MAKVKKQEKHMMQLQSKMTSQQMKTTFIWTIPLLLLWWLFLIPIYANAGPVAYLPGIGGDWALPLVWWYLVCSLPSNALLTHLLGLSLGDD